MFWWPRCNDYLHDGWVAKGEDVLYTQVRENKASDIRPLLPEFLLVLFCRLLTCSVQSVG